ncbi:hypothetical protein [Floricoccus penangensis]|uniref:hypothetical protein n=1 Tax=Floricoccus penangensis TaxID=1859475 RepID=UPI002041A0A7|nr:hypothetical protein [Floricoccus penangensis]URZ88145.1 hypothetical protein KIW23_03680 [Floricoccus penangensis]
MEKKKNKKILTILFVAIAVIYIIYTIYINIAGNYSDYKKDSKLYDPTISDDRVIARFSNGNDIDVLINNDDVLEMHSYSVSDADGKKLYKKIQKSYEEKVVFSKDKITDKSEFKLDKEEMQISTVLAVRLDGRNKELKRYPVSGVTLDPNIKNLKIDDQKVEKVIDYKYGENTYYIWYYSNLKLKNNPYDTLHEDIDISW